jgi:hypothetical protein
MSPDNFLSQHRIRYDGIGLHGSPTEIVANLKAASATRFWDEDFETLGDIVYQTPGFVPGVIGPNSFSPQLIKAEAAAVNKYFEVLPSGDLNKVHQAVDKINTVRTKKGGIEFIPMSDFDILAHSQSLLGETCRHIISERASVAETGFGSYSGSPLPWFDTEEGFNALAAYKE